MKDRLSIREKQVLLLILDELSSFEIAQALGLSIRTVETHRKNISKKTSSKNLIGLLKYAIRAGMIEGYLYKAPVQKAS